MPTAGLDEYPLRMEGESVDDARGQLMVELAADRSLMRLDVRGLWTGRVHLGDQRILAELDLEELAAQGEARRFRAFDQPYGIVGLWAYGGGYGFEYEEVEGQLDIADGRVSGVLRGRQRPPEVPPEDMGTPFPPEELEVRFEGEFDIVCSDDAQDPLCPTE